MTREVPLRFAIRLAWLVVLVGAVLANASHRGPAIPLVAGAAAAWVVWTTAEEPRYNLAAILVIASAGAVLSLWTPVALGFVAMAGIAAGSTFELKQAALVALAGPAVLVVVFVAAGWSTGVVAGGAAGALAGLVGGVARRQARHSDEQRARTHLAREVHDVLAHTLAALAVQLEAAEAVLEAGDEPKLRELLQRSRRLVADGIDETAEAVRALRDEPVEIAGRLRELVDDETTLRIEGAPRPLPARAGLALYRAAQEALTNARKHAPGEPTQVVLTFSRGETILQVANSTPAETRSQGPGSRLGLQGMRERVEMAGGTLSADASSEAFVVRAKVPA